MEPLSALSITTAVTQFLDFTGTIVVGTWKVYRSNPGKDAEKYADIRTITTKLIELSKKISVSVSGTSIPAVSQPDRDLAELAGRCNEVGERIILALDRLRSQSQHQVWASFKIALRTVWSQAEIDALSRAMDSYRQQISMHILVNMREQVVSSVHHNKNDMIEIQDLCRRILNETTQNAQWQGDMIDSIRRGYLHSTKATKDTIQPKEVLKRLHASDSERISHHLLRSLYFGDMDQRYDKIPQAYQETFDWIFEPPLGNSRWSDFSYWARSNESPLYWVTGKPGAGKSTLLKYLHDDPRTSSLLREWAGESPLLTASFFFWNSGSKIQMSYEGLVRTVLYQILNKVPSLIPEVLPHRMEAGMLFGTNTIQQYEMPWSWEEILRAFHLLLKVGTENYKIVLFLDGLDEYEGEPSAVLQFIDSLKLPGIKICTSSRPWIAFEDAFGHGPHLRIEDLTRKDIKHYVTSHLQANAGFRELQELDPDFADSLIESVCSKSSGVFLWVFLVTRSLVEGLSEGERLTDLQRRLDSLPTDLENLFTKILESLDTWHLERSSQFFQIVDGSRRPLNLLEMSYADEDDADFAIRAPCSEITERQANARAGLVRRRIIACCKGLLEAKSAAANYLPYVQVGYLHRTVKDFLKQPATREKLSSTARADFNVYLRLYNANVMHFKIQSPEDLNDTLLNDLIDYGIEYSTKADPKCGALQLSLLNELGTCVMDLATTRLQDGSTYLDELSRRTQSDYWTWALIDGGLKDGFLALAVKEQLVDYVDFTLRDMALEKRASILPRLIDIAENPHNTYMRRIGRARQLPKTPNWGLLNMLNDHARIADAEASDERGFSCFCFARKGREHKRKSVSKVTG